MAGKVLVAYATRYGSTKEVADAIAKRLAEHGVAADVIKARDALSLEGYSSVLLATPVYMGNLLKDAKEFLVRHATTFEKVNVAIAALGPISAEEDLAESRKQLDEILGKMRWVRPVAIEMFVGKYDPSRLGIVDKLIAALPASPLHGATAHDDRDWHAIQAWADTLPGALQMEA